MKSYRELDIYNDSKKFAIEVYSQSECDETIVHLDFLFETESLADKIKYDDLRNKYDLLSKRINKLIQWVGEHWNEFPSPETGNL
jgi:hypothetical protein